MKPSTILAVSAVLGLSSLAGASLAGAQVFPESHDAFADTWIDASGSHPGDAVLRVGKLGNERTFAVLDFDLDNTVTFFDLDCNFWHNVERAELVLAIEEVSGCSAGGCGVRVFRDDGTEGQPLTGLVRLGNGATGEVRFDITSDVVGLAAPDLFPSYRIEQQNSPGEVVFKSAETTTGSPPRIEITNRELPDTTAAERKSLRVFDFTMSYLEAGDPASENQFLLIHGVPSYSIMYRNVMPGLAELGHVVAVDWIGLGFSSHPTRADFDYTFQNQTAHLAELVRLLGLTEEVAS